MQQQAPESEQTLPINDEEEQFKLLCDEVGSALAMMHTSMLQFIDLKDLLLRHNLPPNVALRISLVAGDVFRTFSDMKISVNEMTRVVRVFSSSWEKKVAALRKMHEDYQRKTAELNIALRKLAIQEAEVARVTRERRIQNWARLFSRVQTAQGHGRRWKFRMHDFKKKAAIGIENLGEYFHVKDEDLEGDADEAGDKATTRASSKKSKVKRETDGEEEDENAEDDEEKDDEEAYSVRSSVESARRREEQKARELPPVVLREYSDMAILPPVPTRNDLLVEELGPDPVATPGSSNSRLAPPPATVPEKPEVQERAMMTMTQMDFLTSLHMTVGGPVLLGSPQEETVQKSPALSSLLKALKVGGSVGELRCLVLYAEHSMKSGLLPPPTMPETSGGKKVQPKRMASKWRTTNVEAKPGAVGDNEEEEAQRKKLLELRVPIPKSVVAGASMDVSLNKVQVQLWTGQEGSESLVASGEISLDDLMRQEIPVVFNAASRVGSALGSVPEEHESTASTSSPVPGEPPVVPVPLECPLQVDGVSVGHLPLLVHWHRQQQLTHTNRASSAVHRSEREMGCSPDLVPLLHREMQNDGPDKRSAAVSPRVQTPVVESIPKTVHESIIQEYEEKLSALQTAYETRLQSMAEEIQQSILAREERGVDPISRVTSANSTRSQSAVRKTPSQRVASSRDGSRVALDKGVYWNYSDADLQCLSPERSGIGRYFQKPLAERYNRMPVLEGAWPEDFYDRLSHYSNLSAQHKQELTERVRREVALVIEQRMAEAYKLSVALDSADSRQQGGDLTDALQDVCLPALFMPHTNASGTVYNPRAHQYFHPIGLKNLRLTQPPSMFQLPPIKPQQVSVLNMFEMCRQIRRRTPGNPTATSAANQSGNSTAGPVIRLAASQPNASRASHVQNPIGETAEEYGNATKGRKSNAPRGAMLYGDETVLSHSMAPPPPQGTMVSITQGPMESPDFVNRLPADQ